MLLEQRDGLARQIATQEEMLRTLTEREQSLHSELGEQEERLLALKRESSLQQQKNAAFQLHQSELLERKYKLETQREKIRLSLDAAGDRLWEEYGPHICLCPASSAGNGVCRQHARGSTGEAGNTRAGLGQSKRN